MKVTQNTQVSSVQWKTTRRILDCPNGPMAYILGDFTF